MTMGCDSVKWKRMTKNVWHRENKRFVPIPFYCVNIIDDYNNNINSVDVADQIRGSYQFYHWMRKHK